MKMGKMKLMKVHSKKLKATAIIDLTIDCLNYESGYEYDADYEKSADSWRVKDFDDDVTIEPFALEEDEDTAQQPQHESASRWQSFEVSASNKLLEECPLAAQRKLSLSMRWNDSSTVLDECPGAPSRRISLDRHQLQRRSRVSGCSIASIPSDENESGGEAVVLASSFRRVSLKDAPPSFVSRRRSRYSDATLGSIPPTTNEDEDEHEEETERNIEEERRVESNLDLTLSEIIAYAEACDRAQGS